MASKSHLNIVKRGLQCPRYKEKTNIENVLPQRLCFVDKATVLFVKQKRRSQNKRGPLTKITVPVVKPRPI